MSIFLFHSKNRNTFPYRTRTSTVAKKLSLTKKLNFTKYGTDTILFRSIHVKKNYSINTLNLIMYCTVLGIVPEPHWLWYGIVLYGMKAKNVSVKL